MSKKQYSIIAFALILLLLAVAIAYMLLGEGWERGLLHKKPAQDGEPPGTVDQNIIGRKGEADVRTQNKIIDAKDEVVKTQDGIETTQENAGRVDSDVRQPGTAAKGPKVKAVYVSGPVAGTRDRVNRIIDLVKRTELNAIVLDVKEAGRVNYRSSVPEVVSNGAYEAFYDPDFLLKELHANNIYVIGRVVCFRDNVLATRRADLAIKKKDGQLWREANMAWTNPYNKEVWSYNIDIAKEAVIKGFDEIQFDYVRFPTTRENEVDYGVNMPSKVDAICGFLKAARDEICRVKTVPISADVFGIICESPGDTERIGQELENIGRDIDYISPMVYPSHYANAASAGYNANGVGQVVNGILFKAPDLDPYGVVYNTLVRARDRISAVSGYRAGVRPYLQGFTAGYLPAGYYQNYGAQQIRQQIRAVYDAGYEEWIIWDHDNDYPEEAFEKE